MLPGAMEGVAQQALAEFGDVEQRHAENLRSDLQEWRKRREDYLDFKEDQRTQPGTELPLDLQAVDGRLRACRTAVA